MNIRPRRLRDSALIRELAQETTLSRSQLIQPYFLAQDPKGQEPITGFSGVLRLGIEPLSKKIEADIERGVQKFLLFGSAPLALKDEKGSHGYSSQSLLCESSRKLKQRFGDASVLFSDVCLCPYTSHGHCGLTEENRVDNDSTLEVLSKMALEHAQAGIDFVAPSDMMDGRVGAIRKKLNEKGFQETGILAYTAKYASSYYGPFREALGSSPQAGVSDRLKDRATYQMDFHNTRDALRELELDVAEGADMVMVKPALAYLDIISEFRKQSPVPVVAYSVSGEYQMVKTLVAQGLAEESKLVYENLIAI